MAIPALIALAKAQVARTMAVALVDAEVFNDFITRWPLETNDHTRKLLNVLRLICIAPSIRTKH